MKSRTYAALFLFIFSLGAFAQANLIPTANNMSNQQVWDALLAINGTGETLFGKCRLQDATTCASCACKSYFKAKVVGALGMYGWPKNPSSGDSTGCNNGSKWGGYTNAMATSDLKANAKAMLLHALNANACGTPVPPTNTGGVSILDNSKIFFVDPKASCANGEALCGTTGLGSSVGSLVQFTKLPKSFCRAAFAASMKAKTNQAKMINCNQLSSNSLSTQTIQNAASMMSILNTSYGVFEMSGLQKYLDYDDTQLKAMSTQEVALYYVAVEKNSNKLPNELKSRVVPSKFSTDRADGEKWIIQSEITAAELTLADISKGVVVGKNFTLEQTIQFLQTQASSVK